VDDPQMQTVVLPTIGSIPQPANVGPQAKSFSAFLNVQHIVGLFNDRLTFIGNLDYRGSDATNRTNVGDPNARVTNSRVFTFPYRVASTFAVSDALPVYLTRAEVYSVNNSRRDLKGDLLPNPTTTSDEGGVKFSFLGGRLTSTLAYFRIVDTNVAVFAGVDPSGLSYFAPVGTTERKGWDFDISAAITANWQIVATSFRGTNRTVTGAPFANSYKGSWSVVSRYEFKDGSLKGLNIGGGASTIIGRLVGSGGIVFPVGQTAPTNFELESDVLANVFATYTRKNWTFRLNVENLLDKVMPMGAQAAWVVDPSLPRTVSLATTYRF
jgi:iron complex outermembrane receptor protein